MRLIKDARLHNVFVEECMKKVESMQDERMKGNEPGLTDNGIWRGPAQV